MRGVSQCGSISGIILAGVSLITIIGAVVGLAVSSKNITQETQASIARSDVHLVKGSVSGVRVDDRTVRLFGDFCYSRYLQSGGAENWSMYPTDERGSILKSQSGSRHIDSGKVYVSALGDFPAHCKRVNNNTGEAEWQVKNLDVMQPHSFSFEARLPEKLEGAYCPSVYLNYRGTWMSGIPFAKVDLKTIPGLCQPQATATPAQARPTSSPPSVPLTPAAQNTPDEAISGYITVNGCKKPEYIKLGFCKDLDCKQQQSLRYNIPDEKTPVKDGIWLHDTNSDNTWVYKYSMTYMGDKPLDPAQSYRLVNASAVFNNNTMFIRSKAEDPANLIIKPGTRRDFQINAEQACSCQIKSVAYIKDAQGNIITSLDNQPGTYGLSNNFQYSQNKSRPASEFRNGRVTVGPGSYTELYDPKIYGPDAMASSKLFAPGWKVLKQECVSRGPVQACPQLASDYSQTADKLPHPELFQHLRVTCGVDLEYGWVIERLPTPPPVVNPNTPPARSSASDVFSNLSCPLRNDREPDSSVNRDCSPRNFRLDVSSEENGVKEASVRTEWDRPANCPAFKPGDDKYMAVVVRKSDGVIVAVRKGMKDENTSIKVSDRNWNLVPGQKTEIRYWGEGQKYIAHLYAFNANNESCVSKPSTFEFTGVKVSDDDDEEENEGDDEEENNGTVEGCSSARNEQCSGTGHGEGPSNGAAMCSSAYPGSEWVGWCNEHDNSCCRTSGGDPETPPANPPANPPGGGNGERRCIQDWTTLQAAAQHCESRGGPRAGFLPISKDGQSVEWCCSERTGSGLYSDEKSTNLTRLDIDNNGIINIADMLILIDNYGALEKDFVLATGHQSPDFNGDKLVNSLDYGALIQYLGTEVTTQ